MIRGEFNVGKFVRGLKNQDWIKHQLLLLTKVDLMVIVTGRYVITWFSSDRQLTAGLVSCYLFILVSLLFQVEM
jgi:hypothetical protein